MRKKNGSKKEKKRYKNYITNSNDVYICLRNELLLRNVYIFCSPQQTSGRISGVPSVSVSLVEVKV